ncbi:hypothetical protein R1sor_017351 [Riccia sorocarpa]|uniref:Uncharacterized protein n=1 Tax=Riccia sorocarpa TaxID=122646 RepID=A0ABD3I9Y8_9MARC
MTRPPRLKYPSDSVNYHNLRCPGFAHTIRLPEDLLQTYDELKRTFGPRTSYTDVVRFGDCDAADDPHEVAEDSDQEFDVQAEDQMHNVFPDPQVHAEEEQAVRVLQMQQMSGRRCKPGWINAALELWDEQKNRLQQELLQRGKALVVYVDCRFDSSRSGFHGTIPVINFEEDRVIEMITLTRKETGSSWKIETAALEQALSNLEEKGLQTEESGSKLQLVQRVSLHLKLPEAGTSTKIQRTRPLRYPELAAHDITYKLKSWIYTCAKNAAMRDSSPEVLTKDIHNAATHSAGNHTACRTLPGPRKCVTENWDQTHDCKYVEGGETHKAPTFSLIETWLYLPGYHLLPQRARLKRQMSSQQPPPVQYTQMEHRLLMRAPSCSPTRLSL